MLGEKGESFLQVKISGYKRLYTDFVYQNNIQ